MPHRTVNVPTTWEIPRDVGALLRCSYYHHYSKNYKGFRNSVSRNQGQRPNMRTSTPVTQEIPRSLGVLCQEPEVKVTQSCPTLRPRGLYSPWNSPGPNNGVGSCSLLQGIFPTPGIEPNLPHCRWILYQLSHQGSPSGARGRNQVHISYYVPLTYSETGKCEIVNMFY